MTIAELARLSDVMTNDESTEEQLEAAKVKMREGFGILTDTRFMHLIIDMMMILRERDYVAYLAMLRTTATSENQIIISAIGSLFETPNT